MRWVHIHLNTSESVRKIKVLSDFSNRLCESQKYLIFNGITKSLHCKKNIFILIRAAKSIHFFDMLPLNRVEMRFPGIYMT